MVERVEYLGTRSGMLKPADDQMVRAGRSSDSEIFDRPAGESSSSDPRNIEDSVELYYEGDAPIVM